MDIQLKEKLIAKISNSDDEELLQQLLRILDLEAKTSEYYILSEEENDAVNEGVAQLDKGIFLSNEEVNRQADRCLNR